MYVIEGRGFIDRDVLYDTVEASMHDNPHLNEYTKGNHYDEHRHFLHMIYNAPLADVRPVVHSRFVDGACQNCGWFGDCVDTPYYKFCPECGATMDLEEKETTNV